ncbi:P-loop containing nucleoside triphosphate hydrolase protein [Ephemerocybe angulata]|uniref:DNA 3'-5' helicase n=1 Tax=Ephemerocybe angulata TaxID=980116 RepID=A0A8H6HEJ6_9AGAR|nr:P-loop containing nucleoside triphosphate hydrolase protein [Tulosesus angulatus]
MTTNPRSTLTTTKQMESSYLWTANRFLQRWRRVREKTGFFAFMMIVMKAISVDPSLALGASRFPKNPAMMVVLPTKALQEDMISSVLDVLGLVLKGTGWERPTRTPPEPGSTPRGFLNPCLSLRSSLVKLGLDAVVINGDTVSEARARKTNLWTECRKEHSIILISPEELISPSFRDLLSSKEFAARVCRLGIDEAHLIYSWGASRFRTAFLELGHIHTRLPAVNGGFIPVIATSATIRAGPPMESICTTLGLVPGEYHLLRHSNLRRDIRITLRQISSSISGVSFPELDWLLDCKENTVVFCQTISLGFRLTAYLWRRGMAKGMADLPSRIRMFNSLNSADFNQKTLGFLNNNESSSIKIATDVLSVGWDSPWTTNAVLLGEPDDLDEFVQKIGRAGRDRTKVSHPRAFLYYSKTSTTTAEKLLKATESSTRMRVEGTAMDISMARFLLAPCKSASLNEH